MYVWITTVFSNTHVPQLVRIIDALYFKTDATFLAKSKIYWYLNVMQHTLWNSILIIYSLFSVTSHDDVVFPCSFWEQFQIIFGRIVLQLMRNKPMMYTQFLHHLLSGLLVGGVFLGTGQDGAQTIAVFKYCISINVFFMYTYTMVPVLLCKYRYKMFLLLFT